MVLIPQIIASFLAVVLDFHLADTIAAVNPRNGVFINGDLIIGGLVPVHLSPHFAPHPGEAVCKGVFHLRGYRGVEAMLFALELINNDSYLLPNITLGADIKDTCGSVDFAIMECLNFDFIKSVFADSDASYCSKARSNNSAFVTTNSSSNQLAAVSNFSECCTRNKRRMVAVVGAAFSGVTMAAAGLAGLFRVPVVSFSSTSRLLSDRARFSYFFRTVPSDELQAQAIVDILDFLRWHYIITVASDNEYGRSGINALKHIIRNATNRKETCIVVDELFSRKDGSHGIREIFDKIKHFPKAKVIVLYVEFPDAEYFFKMAKSVGLKDYMFIASDSWAGSLDAIKDAASVISTVIGLRPPSPVIGHFNEYFYQKIQDDGIPHTWTTECPSVCVDNIDSECYTGIHQNGYVSYVIDAVFAIAHALHAMLRCTKRTCAEDWRTAELRNLADFIHKVTFAGISSNPIRFDQNGGANGKYDIHQFIDNEYRHIGQWDEAVRPSLQIRNLSSLNGSTSGLPTSVCSRECNKGEYKVPIPHLDDCCWRCAKCVGRTFANTSGLTSCAECPMKTWPTDDHTDCHKIEARYLAWDGGWAVAITCISLIGCAVVTWTMAVFQWYRGTAVVRASSRHLCHVLLLGIALFYVTPLVYIAKPSSFSCKLIPFMFGMCFVLVVGTIMLKTNRISRIFNEKLLQNGRSSCLGDGWQIVWLVCLLAIELVVCFGWVYGTSLTPSPEEIYSKNSQDASLVCDFSGSKVGFSLWLIYNAGLIVVCTYQAFLVRKVPQNYNESKFIAFSMTTICITVLVFVPSYMGTSGWYRAVISCFLFIFLGSATWASIFIPKIYIIFLRPHKNVPMRPSTSSVALGVILPSPTVVSNIGDLDRRSRTSSLSADCNDAWDRSNVTSCDGGSDAAARDMCARDHEELSECFGGEIPENGQHSCELGEINEDERKEKTYPVVQFEDDVFVDDFAVTYKPKLVEKKSNSKGILRSEIFHIGDDIDHRTDNVSCCTDQKGKRNSLKRKTSSVRFRDQPINATSDQKQDRCGLAVDDRVDNEQHLAKRYGMKLEDAARIEEARREGADVCSDVCGDVCGDVRGDVCGDVRGDVCGDVCGDVRSDVKETGNGHVNIPDTTKRRKMSVCCLDHRNEQKEVKQGHHSQKNVL